MTSRIRLARVVIQLEAFADDGETLAPIQLDPVSIHHTKLPNWYAVTLPAELTKLEAQLNDTDEITSDLVNEVAAEAARLVIEGE